MRKARSRSASASTVLRRRTPKLRPAAGVLSQEPRDPASRGETRGEEGEGKADELPRPRRPRSATTATTDADSPLSASGPTIRSHGSTVAGRGGGGRGSTSRRHYLGVPMTGASLSGFRRSHLDIDPRPLRVTVLERYVRFCETTHIHGCQPCQRVAVVGWGYRLLYAVILAFGISCATYFITTEILDFEKKVVELSHDFEQATTEDLYFPQVVICNSNFIQATFLEEFQIAEFADLLVKYYFTGSSKPITKEEEAAIGYIEAMTLARRVAGALMRFGNSTSMKQLLQQVENKTDKELLDLAEANRMPTPLPLVTGLKPGFRSILRATYNNHDRSPNFMAPMYPSYRTDFGWCSLVIPMVEFDERYKEDNFQKLREKRAPKALRGTSIGKDGGLRLLVDAEVYDYSYGSYGAEGFQVGIIPHRDIPLLFLQNTQVKPGSLTNIIVDPLLTKTEDEVRARFEPTVRQCYFQDEVETDPSIGIGGKNRHRYTMSNCYWQGTVGHATDTCGCKMWNYGEATAQLSFCVGENLTCFMDVLKDFGRYTSFTDNNNKTYQCFNDCNSFTHSLSTNSGSYPNSETFLHDFHDYCAILDKMAMSCKDLYKRELLDKTTFNCTVLEENSNDVETCVNFVYARGDFDDSAIETAIKKFKGNVELRQAAWNYTSSNVALIHVYLNDINVRRLVRKEAYQVPHLFSAIGGHLGLAMGMSFITLFEAGYLGLRVVILLVAHAISHWGVKRYHERKSHLADPDWRKDDPVVTSKPRVICTDCPCPWCC